MPVPVGREQRLVAMLLLSANRVVPLEKLIDAVWPDDPPATAKRQVQNRLSVLRGRLARAGCPAVIAVDGPGYRIGVGTDELDAARFDRLVRQARTGPADRPEQAVQLLRQALDLWRGSALDGLDGRVIRAAAARLDEQRLATYEQYAQLRLGLGQHGDLVGELAELVAAHPLRERLVGQLMRALHGSARRADALHAYHDLRSRLAGDLGVDPSPELQRLHSAVLADDPGPTGTAGSAAVLALGGAARAESTVRPQRAGGPVRPNPVPAQLPLDLCGFTGRTDELARLDALLAGADEHPTAVVVCVVWGTAGVGKTALAVHWAHRARESFPDGQLYVNLRGFDPSGPALAPAPVVRGFLTALGVPPYQIPPEPAAQVSLYRSTMAGRRVLVVLDNARDAAQVRPLLPSSPGCHALITSRTRMPGLLAAEGAQPVALDLLPAVDARDLLARRLGRDRLQAEPAAVDDIVRWCAGLPLALAIAAAHAVARPTFRLATLAAQLRQARGLLEHPGADPTVDPRAVFATSYHALSSPAAALFRLLGLHPGPDTSRPAATVLAGIPPRAAATALAELTAAHLLTEPAPGRYTMHDLLRAYASELTHLVDSERDRRTAVRRMLDHYLHTAHDAALLLHPHRDPLTLDPPAPGVVGETLTDLPQARAWFITEHRVLLGAIDQAAAAGFDAHVWRLAWTLTNYLDRQGHWQDWVSTNTAALGAAHRLADQHAQAHTHHSLGLAHLRLGRNQTGYAHLRQALRLHQRLADGIGQAHTHLNLALARQRQGRLTDALQHAQLALDLFITAGHQAGQGNALNTVGWYHAQLGDHRLALNYCERALAIQQHIADRHEQAFTWDSIGYAHHHLGDHHQATVSYQHAIDLWRHLGDRYYEAETTIRLGDAHLAAGDPAAARTDWRHALGILDTLGHPDARQLRAKLASVPGPTQRS